MVGRTVTPKQLFCQPRDLALELLDLFRQQARDFVLLATKVADKGGQARVHRQLFD